MIKYDKPAPSFVLFSRISTLSESVCFPAIALIKVACLLPSFMNGENRPWTSTSDAIRRMNSPCPLKVKDRPSRVVRCGSPRAPPSGQYKTYHHTYKKLETWIISSLFFFISGKMCVCVWEERERERERTIVPFQSHMSQCEHFCLRIPRTRISGMC